MSCQYCYGSQSAQPCQYCNPNRQQIGWPLQQQGMGASSVPDYITEIKAQLDRIERLLARPAEQTSQETK